MATKGHNGRSLTDILNVPSLRADLVAAVALSSDDMRRQLLATFEPRQRLSDELKSNAFSNLQDDDQAIAQEESLEAIKRDREDIESSRTQGLRRAALTYFDKWQIDVLRRLGEVLSVRPDAIRKARADAKATAENATKSKQDKDFLTWADGEDLKEDNSKHASRMNNLPDGYVAKVAQLSKEDRLVVLESVMLLLLSLEHYTSHSRILLTHLTRILRLPLSTLNDHESKVAQGLLASAAAEMSADGSTERRAAEGQAARRWKVGMATFAGAALIGVTGGLAAPFLAAGIGGIMGGLGLGAVATLLGPLATNMVLVGGLFGAYGGRMTGAIMEKYAQEVQDFKFLPVAGVDSHGSTVETLQDRSVRDTRKLRVAIGVSGAINSVSDFADPWTVLSVSRVECFGLRWETDALLRLSENVALNIRKYAIDFASYNLLTLVVAGLWPFGLLRTASALDNPFAIAKARSDKAGKVLADALIHKVQGERPVTLIGYSMGARVMYSCLLQLAEENAFGLIENVILMGAPTPSDTAMWRRIRTVVSGRVVNTYSANDFVLAFLYRATGAQLGIAGLQEIVGVAGVENFDLTELVKGHDAYRLMVGTILQRVGCEDVDGDTVVRQIARQAIESKNASKDGTRSAEKKTSKKHALAKTDQTGQVLLVNEKGVPLPIDVQGEEMDIHYASEGLSEGDEQDSRVGIELVDNDGEGPPMSTIDPIPEVEHMVEHETISFGHGDRSFEVKWDH